jgi:hypothetical protein
MSERPYQPFYKPYGMTDEEYEYEKRIAAEKLEQWEQEQNESNLLDAQVSGIYYDKNGVEITDGCTIYNEWDRDKYHKIVKNENGELCFAIDMTVLDKRYATDRFWEVVNSR